MGEKLLCRDSIPLGMGWAGQKCVLHVGSKVVRKIYIEGNVVPRS